MAKLRSKSVLKCDLDADSEGPAKILDLTNKRMNCYRGQLTLD